MYHLCDIGTKSWYYNQLINSQLAFIIITDIFWTFLFYVVTPCLGKTFNGVTKFDYTFSEYAQVWEYGNAENCIFYKEMKII